VNNLGTGLAMLTRTIIIAPTFVEVAQNHWFFHQKLVPINPIFTALGWF